MSRSLKVVHISGLTPYDQGHQLQRETVDAVKAGNAPHTLLLLEHTPVVTLGKNADARGVLASPERLAQFNVTVHRIERGGQATYHCPGQLVGYPIMDLHQLKLGAARYVHLLEEVLIRICSHFDVTARRIDGLTGIFTEQGAKIGALGIRISRGISWHGFALNISPDLSGYNLIVPCGLTDTPMARIGDFTDPPPSMTAVKQVAAQIFAEVFQLQIS
ncbi:MAG: lipoyl(octanoyl) transferase LipB [Deltaproteobacteria bacterium]|nr:lipoyl(octanoyl) transferase LipB [Deltaproteobacteria bacterium]